MMFVRSIAVGLALVLATSALAVAQDGAAPQAWSALSDQKFAFHAEGARITATVAPGDIILSIPITHLRSGIVRGALVEPNTGETLADAGAPGFYAGEFGGDDVWCFARKTPQPTARVACFVERSGTWYVAGPVNNDYYPTSVQLSALLPPVGAVEIEERAVSVAADLRAEYRFRRWTRQGAEADLLIGGRPVLAGTYTVYQTFQRQADGSALLATPVGVVRLVQDGRRNASISNVSVQLQ